MSVLYSTLKCTAIHLCVCGVVAYVRIQNRYICTYVCVYKVWSLIVCAGGAWMCYDDADDRLKRSVRIFLFGTRFMPHFPSRKLFSYVRLYTIHTYILVLCTSTTYNILCLLYTFQAHMPQPQRKIEEYIFKHIFDSHTKRFTTYVSFVCVLYMFMYVVYIQTQNSLYHAMLLLR